MEFFNVKGRISHLAENGYGFFVPEKLGDHLIVKGIFFNVSNIVNMEEDNFLWSDLKLGMKVEAGQVIGNTKGYQALEVTIPMTSISPETKKRKNHNF